MVGNIRRARERILYDRSLAALSSEKHVTQTALFPVEVPVGAAQLPLFEEHREMLAALGFDIRPSGTDAVEVAGVPEGYSCEPGKVEQMVSDLLLLLSEEPTGLQELMNASMAARFAALGASSADKISSPVQAQALLDTLFASENAEFSPSGKRIVAVVPIEDIDNKF